MDLKDALNFVSLGTGLFSAFCWVCAAFVKVKPPPEFNEVSDGMYHGHIIANGADLVPTVRAQAKWNSAAAISAAFMVLVQIVANMTSG